MKKVLKNVDQIIVVFQYSRCLPGLLTYHCLPVILFHVHISGNHFSYAFIAKIHYKYAEFFIISTLYQGRRNICGHVELSTPYFETNL